MKVLIVDDDPWEWSNRCAGIDDQLAVIATGIIPVYPLNVPKNEDEDIAKERLEKFLGENTPYEKEIVFCPVSPAIFKTIQDDDLKKLDIVMFDICWDSDNHDDEAGLYAAGDFIIKKRFDNRKVVAVTNKRLEYEVGRVNRIEIRGRDFKIRAYQKSAAYLLAGFFIEMLQLRSNRTDLITNVLNELLLTPSIYKIFHTFNTQSFRNEPSPSKLLEKALKNNEFSCCHDDLQLFLEGVKALEAKIQVQSTLNNKDRGYNKPDKITTLKNMANSKNILPGCDYLFEALASINSADNTRLLDVCFPRVTLEKNKVFLAYLEATLQQRLNNLPIIISDQSRFPVEITVTNQINSKIVEITVTNQINSKIRVPLSWFWGLRQAEFLEDTIRYAFDDDKKKDAKVNLAIWEEKSLPATALLLWHHGKGYKNEESFNNSLKKSLLEPCLPYCHVFVATRLENAKTTDNILLYEKLPDSQYRIFPKTEILLGDSKITFKLEAGTAYLFVFPSAEPSKKDNASNRDKKPEGFVK